MLQLRSERQNVLDNAQERLSESSRLVVQLARNISDTASTLTRQEDYGALLDRKLGQLMKKQGSLEKDLVDELERWETRGAEIERKENEMRLLGSSLESLQNKK